MGPLDADIPKAMTARTRRWIDAGAIVLAVAAALSTLLAPGSSIRAPLVFFAFALVPGWALLTLGRSGPPAAMLGLAIGLSIAIDIAGSLVVLWARMFDEATFAAIVASAAVMLLIADIGRGSPSAA